MRLQNVERVLRAAAITPLPQAPEVVLGILDLGGSIIPVMDLRRRFRLPARKITPHDQFVVARTASRTVALVVDAAGEVVAPAQQEEIPAHQVAPGSCYLSGVTRTADGLVLIHDLDTFLSAAEDASLAAALAEGEI